MLLSACGTGIIEQGTGVNGPGPVSVSNVGGSTGASGSSSGNSSGSGSTQSGGSSASSNGRESWVWVYTNWQTSLNAIAANPNSFTHISPTFYSLNYNYTSGVPYYSNCPFSSGLNCSANGTNNFDGLTTAQFTAAVKSYGMVTIPAIYAGSANSGSDQGVQNILANTGNAAQNFIDAMVTEAINNGYGGYNLDWEMGSTVGAADANAFVAFVNQFKAALAAHGMTLSLDAIVSNINGTWCSGNNGYLDFAKLARSSIDRVIIEDYTQYLGTASNQCQTAVLSSSSPASCPVSSNNQDVTAVGLLNFMCTNLPDDMVVIGLEAYSSASNAIAGSAISAMQSYGMNKVAVWPQVQSGYPFLSASGLVASESNWYSLLLGFLGQ